MVVDLLLDVLFGALGFLVGLFPGIEIVPDGLRVFAWGNQIGPWFGFINFFLPIRELFIYVPRLLVGLLILGGARFVVSVVRG